jgi:RNase P subunit RPR2
MKENERQNHWVCAKCEEPLEKSKVQVRYLGNVFTMEMLTCPKCGTALVTEELAIKKMAEAEMLLEDK